MPSTIKFIDTVIRNIKSQNKRQTFWCYGCPGFGLRVNPSGTKVFVFKYMSGDNKEISRWISIAKYPAWSIQRARAEYDRLYEQVYQYGRDPVVDKRAEIEKQKNNFTVSVFIDVYLEHARLKGKASVREEERVFNLDVIPTIGEKILSDVNADDIDKIQSRILKRAKKTATASRGGKVAVKNSLAYTRQLFNFAKKKRLIDSNPVTEVDSLGIAGSRSRILSFEEIWLFWNRIELLGIPPVTARSLKFTLATMQRSTEVRNMRYAAFKPDEAIWQMEKHETKNRTMHRVPLNQYALDIIESVKPFTIASPFVFGATRTITPPTNPSADLIPLGNTAMPQAVRKNRDTLGIQDFCPHDLRRTGATWITAAGLPKLYARLMLNHNDGDGDVTGEVYVQYSYDFEKQRAAKVWEFILDQIVKCESPEDVPTLDELRKRVKESGLL